VIQFPHRKIPPRRTDSKGHDPENMSRTSSPTHVDSDETIHPHRYQNSSGPTPPPSPLLSLHPLTPWHPEASDAFVPGKAPLTTIPRSQQHTMVQRPHRGSALPLPFQTLVVHPRPEVEPAHRPPVVRRAREVVLRGEPRAFRRRQERIFRVWVRGRNERVVGRLPGCVGICDLQCSAVRDFGLVCYRN
jgi:hypothetical protein